MHLHNVRLLKRDKGFLESTELQGDGTAETCGLGLSLVVTLTVNKHFPSAWDAVGYTYSFVGHQIDGDEISEHAHPRLFFFEEVKQSNPRRVRLSAVDHS
jgi:hypothetical protein